MQMPFKNSVITRSTLFKRIEFIAHSNTIQCLQKLTPPIILNLNNIQYLTPVFSYYYYLELLC